MERETIHFEHLWEAAENLLAEETKDRTAPSILTELSAKLSLYQMIENNHELPAEEKQSLKSHLFGKFLITLAQLSAKDNINTFTALQKAIGEAKVSQMEAKYQ